MNLKRKEIMPKQLIKSKKGFTIIEVVLVLAIAGLIFLMVFLALPALQRSQRDTQRRDDLARFQTAITNYQTNNRGKIPGNALSSSASEGQYREEYAKFMSNYLWVGGDEFTDPDGQMYAVGTVCPNLGTPGTYANYCKSLTETATNTSGVVNTGEYDSAWDKDRAKLIAALSTNISDYQYGGVFNHLIYIFQNATCDGEAVVPSTGVRKIAIQFKLESGGIYCSAN